jgi:putative ABC transport system permease protein
MNQVLASMLFGVQPTDIATMVLAIAMITLAAAFACCVPAWRASRLDPSIVLRDE